MPSSPPDQLGSNHTSYTNSEMPPEKPWSTSHLVAFRFAFSFLVLSVFPFPFNSFGGSLYEIGYYEKMWFAAASWLGTHLFRVSATPPAHRWLLLEDTVAGYIELLCFVVLAALATLLWTILDSKRRNYRSLQEVLRIYLRYALAFTMLGYGMDKVFALQFNTSLPGPDRLAQPLGNYSPFALMWTFMGYSKAYTIFGGMGEVTGGVLLLFRRTTTLGAMVVIGVMANVLALDFSYGVGLRMLVSLYLLMAIFVLLPDLKRLSNVLVLNRPALTADLTNSVLDRWLGRSLPLLHLAVVGFALYFFAGPGLKAPRERGNRPESPFYGLYQIEAFTRNGQALPLSDSNWRRVIFERQGDMTVLAMDDSTHYYGADVDPASSAVTISGEYPEIRSNSHPDYSGESPTNISKSTLSYSRPDSDHLVFQGDLAGDSVLIEMRRVDISKFTLVSRGFHWIENGPFYR
jgi:hypothetical protein